jgi:uracil phosphoribosyltransferase
MLNNYSNHAVIADALACLRDVETPSHDFRRAAKCVTRHLIAAASADFPTQTSSVQTPLEETSAERLAQPPVLVPILRAGLGMLDAALDMLPQASVGYLGMERDELTAVARTYYQKLPPIEGRRVLVLDPMLATGGTVLQALEALSGYKPERMDVVAIIAAPEGVEALRQAMPEVRLWLGTLDRELNAEKFILPGLGDFGDRLYGTT